MTKSGDIRVEAEKENAGHTIKESAPEEFPRNDCDFGTSGAFGHRKRVGETEKNSTFANS